MAEEKKKKDLYTWENSSESIFKAFEPYYCGEPAITDTFFDFEFDAEQCTEDNNFQKFKVNGYTEEVVTAKTSNNKNYYYRKDDKKVISGCKKGTVILAGHPRHDTIIEERQMDNIQEEILIEVTGSGDDKKLQITGTDGFNLNYFKEKNDELVFPERLGILLTGMGGGAGGGTWYDDKKNGKSSDQFYCSGGSGGGAGIVWGVIDIAGIETESTKYNSNKDSFKDWAKKDFTILNTDDTNKNAWDELHNAAVKNDKTDWNNLMSQITDIKTKNCYIIAYSNKKYAECKSKYWEHLLYTKNDNQKNLTVNFSNISPLCAINRPLYEKIIWKLMGNVGAVGGIAAAAAGPAAVLAFLIGAGISALVGKTDTYSNIASFFSLSWDEFKDLCQALGKNYPTEPINGHGGINGGTYPADNHLNHNHPQIGTNGINGADLSLYTCVKLSFNKSGQTYTCYCGAIIATAKGGGGGNAGYWEGSVSGGQGGSSDPGNAFFVKCGGINGNSGIDVKKDMPEAHIPARNYSIQFLEDSTTNRDFSYNIGACEEVKANISATTAARIPGGHSFGPGAYNGTEDTAAGIGGGGCSNGADGSCNGGGGCWKIFYA